MTTTSATDDRTISARGWEREVPRYRATRDVFPSPNSRHRHEPPFATLSDPNVWQQAEEPVKAGAEFQSKAWPHASFRPLNRSAEEVMAFFNSAPKSRLGLRPWCNDRIVLNDGLTGPSQPKFSIKTGATAA
jgi:hypothetical protein